MKPGIYTADQLSNEQYHSGPGISKSGLDLINRSPAHYRYAERSEPSRAMVIGSAIHAACLEPEVYAKRYLVLDGIKARTASEYKRAAEVRGAEYVLTEPEGDNINGMMQAVQRNREAQDVLRSPGHAELSVFAECPETGVLVRCRFDFITSDGRALDLKKTQDVRADAFSRSVYNYRYHVQAAFYEDVWYWATGERLDWFKFLAVEEKPPHANKLFLLDSEAIQQGRREYRLNLQEYARCMETETWPGVVQDEELIGLPPWAFTQDDEGGIY